MNAGVIIGKNGGTCLKLRLGAFEGIWCLNDMLVHEMNPASRAWKDMLGQGSENSAGEKRGTRETERLSRNELTFTNLTKKRGTLTYPITDTCDSTTHDPYPPPLLTSHHAPLHNLLTQAQACARSLHRDSTALLDTPSD